MKKLILLLFLVLLSISLTACASHVRRSRRPDDPYLYRRGEWNTSKGGIFDDIPQFLWQMLESLFDYGAQPIDPPSEYVMEQ